MNLGVYTRCWNIASDTSRIYSMGCKIHTIYSRWMSEKQRIHQRIREVELGTFTPLVFSTCDSLAMFPPQFLTPELSRHLPAWGPLVFWTRHTQWPEYGPTLERGWWHFLSKNGLRSNFRSSKYYNCTGGACCNPLLSVSHMCQ